MTPDAWMGLLAVAFPFGAAGVFASGAIDLVQVKFGPERAERESGICGFFRNGSRGDGTRKLGTPRRQIDGIAASARPRCLSAASTQRRTSNRAHSRHFHQNTTYLLRHSSSFSLNARLTTTGRVADTELVESLQETLLDERDFVVVGNLSGSDSSQSRVQLVRTAQGLSARARSRLLVMKSVDRSFGFRMRKVQPIPPPFVRRSSPSVPATITSTRTIDPPPRSPVLHEASNPDHPLRFPLLDELLHRPLACRWRRSQQIHRARDGRGCDNGREARQAMDCRGCRGVAMAERNRLGSSVRHAPSLKCSHSSRTCSDVKPHNLLLTGTGRLLLTDFNSAAPLSTAPLSTSARSSSHTSVRVGVVRRFALTLIGTVDYIAPEILKDAESMLVDSFSPGAVEAAEMSEAIAYGKGVDVWSLGAVAYEVSSLRTCAIRSGLTLITAAVRSNAFLCAWNPRNVRTDHKS